jgi:KipI family sensor histidine kinase inhibitor
VPSALYEKPIFRIAGDRGILVEYGDAIDPIINRKVRSMAIAMSQETPAGVVEYIPTYRSLIIIYDPSVTTPSQLQEGVLSLEERLSEIEIPPPKTVEIPVCYGKEFGPDIDFVAQSHDLTEEDVIRIHSEPVYQIYMIGFTPGFPFLGGLPEVLHTPRLETPRALVPAGSVGIANDQTGIYPVDSPGGWRLIGRTPSKLFDPEGPNPFLLKAGDLLRFKPIRTDEYNRLAEGGRK